MTRTMTSPRRKLAMLAVTTELKKTKSIEGMHRKIVDFLYIKTPHGCYLAQSRRPCSKLRDPEGPHLMRKSYKGER